MEQQGGTQARRRELALLTTLIAVMIIPLSAPNAVAVNAHPTSQAAEAVAIAVPGDAAVEAQDDMALRTTGTLATIVAATAVLVLAWWYLVRRRRD